MEAAGELSDLEPRGAGAMGSLTPSCLASQYGVGSKRLPASGDDPGGPSATALRWVRGVLPRRWRRYSVTGGVDLPRWICGGQG
jgi:hypothetical protein